MARRKTAKADDMATLTVLISFNGLYRGDVVRAPYDPVAQAWEKLGLIRSEVDDDGVSETGPVGTEQDNPGGVEAGAGDSVQAGREQGPGSGSGGYGALEVLDQG